MPFFDRSVTVQGERSRYQVFVPPHWDDHPEWPVVLFLHGAGERGRDGALPSSVGLGPRLKAGYDLPAVVVFPQCHVRRMWVEPEMERIALRTLQKSIEEFRGNRRRLYLTGISMGGYGTFNLAARHPRTSAAAIPICGGVSRNLSLPHSNGKSLHALVAQRLKRLPLWAFHGTDDDIIPVTESRRIVSAMVSVGGRVRYTEYEGVEHNSWDRAYAERLLFPWLLSHSRS